MSPWRHFIPATGISSELKKQTVNTKDFAVEIKDHVTARAEVIAALAKQRIEITIFVFGGNSVGFGLKVQASDAIIHPRKSTQ